MTERKYLPTIADLIDRLSISLMKSIFIDRKVYRAEMNLILADLENEKARPELVYPVLVLMLANRYIWENEAVTRSGMYQKLESHKETADRLMLTHSINGVRTRAKNEISKIFGERVDEKIDCLAADLPPEFGNWLVFDELPDRATD